MKNEHGGRDVIAREISDRMRVPILEDFRKGLEADEYRQVLELAQTIVESTSGSTLPTWMIAIAFIAAAEMYAEALAQGAAVMGRGPGSN